MYCDVSLPVPLDQAFTYELPETLNHRARPGCRVMVPFGSRKLTGVVLRLQDESPDGPTREVLKLMDEQPVLDAELLALGRWVASYYCAPLGEVLRTMTPLGGELRKSKLYSLTDSGRDTARQLLLDAAEETPLMQVLRLLDSRPVSEAYLKKKIVKASDILKTLQKKGFVEVEDVQAERDPLRASAARLRATFLASAPAATKLPKPERELHAFLELHPGSHNLQALEEQVKNASQAARSLARRKLITLELESLVSHLELPKPPRTLNPRQLDAYNQIEGALRTGGFKTFLLHGVTGSGKTEVYLRAIDACLALGRNALLLVP
ncbi:MAG: DEAD/DEAH box helicase family protein, partial [Acidobacteriaceae bacterium]|nr:DEAD/DEAH box helicase family protein [Acidobacteriaceae bacterium]